MKTIVSLAALTLMFGATAALADEVGLPDICKTAPAMAMDMGGGGGKAMPMDDAHKALMAGMDTMNRDMDTGMQAKDADVAFICGMLPHHQGAIDMARGPNCNTATTHGPSNWRSRSSTPRPRRSRR